ncbi:MAG: translation elongation factor Ts [Candidatus Cloacimonetes bacterium]|jgi:elongation factor Ts|nr:translation elongation factor Ts [Candidatus Cloacimonadota bacterium]MDD4155928.1 translation elongation factor Ts [Candidatus Cloacimonadota bacterium]
MEINAKMVKELRDKTGAGMMDCKKALTQCDGDIEKAINWLREKGIAKAVSKSDRDTKEGRIYSYIHSNNKIGVLVEINCETDFVARNEDFETLCKDVCMHIAATNPLAIKAEDLDQELVNAEREIYKNKAINDGKPEAVVEKIVEGQVKKYYKENCLLEQEFVKDSTKTVQDIINETIAKLGENIQVARFTRFVIGE